MFSRSISLVLIAGLISVCAEASTIVQDAQVALEKAARYFRETVSTNGGYLWTYSQDLKQRAGEGKATETQIWIQQPGTPSVGFAYLRAYEATGEEIYLEAARAAADALVWGQLESGGWDYKIDFDPKGSQRWYYRRDKGEVKQGKRRNYSVFDDNNTQNALRFIMAVQKTTGDEEYLSAVEYGLDLMLRSQFENGAWPQVYPLPSKGYSRWYTFNDNAINDCIKVMLDAYHIYGNQEYLESAMRAGDFIIASQIPEPQAGWAQQYDHDMKPAPARWFEPAAVCGAVTARNMRTLIDLYLEAGREKYLEPMPAAIDWLEKSKMEDGKWARFYELGTNKPIYVNRDREVVYEFVNIRSGYSWMGDYGVTSAIALYNKVKSMGREKYLAERDAPPTTESRRRRLDGLEPRVRDVITDLDEQGRWVTGGNISCSTFVRNMRLLSDYISLSRSVEGDVNMKQNIESSRIPYPQSPVIKHLEWATASTIARKARGKDRDGSDNWPLTWADDDNLCTAYGDGYGFEPIVPEKLGLGFARLTGGPKDFTAENIRSDGENKGSGRSGKKGSGVLMVDGVLYIWLFHADNKGGQCQLAWSYDHAKTWTFCDWKFQEFGLCTFINYGRNYSGARDNYVYTVTHDGPMADGPADHMILMRVPRDKIRYRDEYEFFKSLDGNGSPIWTSDIRERGPVFRHKDSCLRSGISYCAPLKRYLWWQHIPNEPGHRDRGDTRFSGGFGIYDAPEPWGPWTTAYFTEQWDVGPGERAEFPTKWMSEDGKTLYLVFSGNDNFSVRKATLSLEPIARSQNDVGSPASADTVIDKQTYTYKTVGKCQIQADVYRLPGDDIRPVILWIHGGALIMGQRASINPEQLNTYLNAGYTVVSIDYRLAPETKIKGIIQDVQDACKWIREKGPELFNIDPDRMAVIGHSAGGYLTLMTGFCIEPRPNALVAFYGYGDIAGAWYSRPDPFYSRQQPVSEQEAYESVGTEVISDDTGQSNRWRFYLYCRQQGLWPREVTGHDPDEEPDAFDLFCPIRNVTAEYPPTLMLHGDADTDVPYKQSVMMAAELKRVGVEHELVTISGSGHGFDGAGIENPIVASALDKVLAFLKQRTQQ